MNIQQTAAVLTKIQLIDNRQVDTLTLNEWHDAIGHLDYEDALEAVRMHRRESTAWLLPAHVTAGVRVVRAARADEARRSRPVPELPGWIETANERAMARQLEGLVKTVDEVK